jgi:hypothetical protein
MTGNWPHGVNYHVEIRQSTETGGEHFIAQWSTPFLPDVGEYVQLLEEGPHKGLWRVVSRHHQVGIADHRTILHNVILYCERPSKDWGGSL